MHKGQALFLDRDGVINVDTGHPHIIKEIQFIEGIFELCSVARKLEYQIIIITNQAGIAKGIYDEAQFFCVMGWMLDVFKKKGIDILDFYCCPHHINGLGKYKKNCRRRKPAPGMILDASTEHNINLKNSIIVGDKTTDLEAGIRAGVGKRFLFKSNNDENEKGNLMNGIRVFTKILDIAEHLKDINCKNRNKQ